ncbi:putative short chain dehydrogenase [Cadophora sp. DSE1049]|nr:putative short chain dehydrogenase [Cadophora sp. DSE1049]
MSSNTNTNTILLITGANTGLGLETVKALYQSSKTTYTILLAGRDISKANAAAKSVESVLQSSRGSVIRTVQIDIEDDESIEKAFDWVKKEFGRLDVLVNNAGGQFDQLKDLSPRTMWSKSWDVNVTGTHLLTSTFIPLLLSSPTPRILFLASGTSSLSTAGASPLAVDKSPEAGWPKQGFSLPAYRASKAGLNMVMREWARLLRDDGVRIWGVSPGFLATGLGPGAEFTRKMGALEPGVGAEVVRGVVEGERDADVGKVVKKDGVQPF